MKPIIEEIIVEEEVSVEITVNELVEYSEEDNEEYEDINLNREIERRE